MNAHAYTLQAQCLKETSFRVYKMLQNIASTKCRKIGRLKNYQRGGNLKKGEVNFERGGSDPLGHYVIKKNLSLLDYNDHKLAKMHS